MDNAQKPWQSKDLTAADLEDRLHLTAPVSLWRWCLCVCVAVAAPINRKPVLSFGSAKHQSNFRARLDMNGQPASVLHTLSCFRFSRRPAENLFDSSQIIPQHTMAAMAACTQTRIEAFASGRLIRRSRIMQVFAGA